MFGSSRLHKWNDLGDIPCESWADAVAGDDLLPYITGICHACCRLRDVVAHSLNHGHFPFIAGGDHVFFSGTRSLDCYERQMADAFNLKMSRGYPDYLNGSENLHISFDVDVLDPAVAPGTGVPEPDGLMLDEAMNVLSEAFRRNKVVSFDLVEFNPSLDVEGRTRKVVDEVIYRLDNDLLP